MKITLKEIPMNETVQAFFDRAEDIGLERREGQIEMSHEVTDAIIGKYPLAVEAGVGIGKSFAYLAPLVLNFYRERRQVIIATSTIALQEQLERDIHTVLKMIGVKAEVIVATGMKNFVCRRRLERMLRRNKDDTMLTAIQEKVYDGIENRKEMKLDIPGSIWNRVCINSYGDKCSSCQSKLRCKYYEMRKKLRTESCFVICNQNMLVAHLINEGRGSGIFNENASTFVIDEVHNIEPKFRNAYTTSMSKGQITGDIREAMKKLNDKSLAEETIEKVTTLFRHLRADIRIQQREADGDMQTFYFNNTEEIDRLLFSIRHNMVQIEKKAKYRLHSLRFLYELCDENLVWLDNSEMLKICICQKDISEDISRLLFRKGRSTILTSATISSGGVNGYDFFLESIGYGNHGDVADPKGSPFDYDNNTMLYTTSALPYPRIDKREEYREKSIAEIVRLLNVTQGKTLILFTAKVDMEYVYKKLSNMHLPYKIIMQGSGSSQEYLLDKFRNDTNSVLLGTGTFWEGINIEGESLSQVIIFKLPFPVPDPIIDYKMSLADDPISEVAVPEMIIKLKQGAGRLIRCASDKGIVSILDPRVSMASKAQYKDKAMEALPERNRTESIVDLNAFWNRVTNKKEAV